MVRLEVVEYGKEDGQLIAIEVYSDGSIRKVQIKNGVVDYILNGSEDVKSTNSVPEKHHGVTITDVKLVGMCSKCRTQDDEILKWNNGKEVPDEDISCVCCGLGCNHRKNTESVNSQEQKASSQEKAVGSNVGGVRNSLNRDKEEENKTPDTHSQIKKEIDKDYAKTNKEVRK